MVINLFFFALPFLNSYFNKKKTKKRNVFKNLIKSGIIKINDNIYSNDNNS
jgi:hypothetical protein